MPTSLIFKNKGLVVIRIEIGEGKEYDEYKSAKFEHCEEPVEVIRLFHSFSDNPCQNNEENWSFDLAVWYAKNSDTLHELGQGDSTFDQKTIEILCHSPCKATCTYSISQIQVPSH